MKKGRSVWGAYLIDIVATLSTRPMIKHGAILIIACENMEVMGEEDGICIKCKDSFLLPYRKGIDSFEAVFT